MSKIWQTSKIVKIDRWHDHLATFYLDYYPENLQAGQYMNLGLINAHQKRVKRSYSLASLNHEPAAFLIVKVEQGAFTSQLFQLSVGDTIDYMPRCMGRFHLDHIPATHTLWLVATGTGLSPYIAMLRSIKIWQKFKQVILIHGVRQQKDLAYYEAIRSLEYMKPLCYIPVVSREDCSYAFRGRITDLLKANHLTDYAPCSLDPTQQHMMLCGHPQMIVDVKEWLHNQGWKINRNQDGQITTEQYWSLHS